jgi:biotin carboxyl carrier protein
MAETAECIMSRMDFSDPAVIASLTAALEAAGVDGIEIEQRGHRLRIVVDHEVLGGARLVETAHTPSRAVQSAKIVAPMAGVFCSDHPASAAPPLALPFEVEAGEPLGFIRIGPILLPVKAETPGVLIRRIAGNGSIVGYGDPLFEFEPRP